MEQKVLITDPNKCTGCRLCEIVCSFVHEGQFNPVLSRIRVITNEDWGLSVPMVCQHCENPICQTVCPTRAIHRDLESGAILIDYDRCIGCKVCMIVCPYGNISIHKEERKMLKCDLCGGDPECVKFCATGAIQYVRREIADMPKKRSLMDKYLQAAIAERA